MQFLQNNKLAAKKERAEGSLSRRRMGESHTRAYSFQFLAFRYIYIREQAQGQERETLNLWSDAP
jgi:hypothetical protein